MLRVPIQPADFVVLAISVVVPILRVANGIPGEQHRHPLGQEHGCNEVPLLSCPQRLYCRIIGWPFYSAVPTAIIIGAVPIVFAVRLVMLGVVADQVLQSETVVRSDEVHACIGTPPTSGIKIAGSGNAVCQLADDAAVALPVGAQSIAIFVVPLSPAHWEFPDLISTFAEIPWFGDKLHLRENRILMNDVQKCTQAV